MYTSIIYLCSPYYLKMLQFVFYNNLFGHESFHPKYVISLSSSYFFQVMFPMKSLTASHHTVHIHLIITPNHQPIIDQLPHQNLTNLRHSQSNTTLHLPNTTHKNYTQLRRITALVLYSQLTVQHLHHRPNIPRRILVTLIQLTMGSLLQTKVILTHSRQRLTILQTTTRQPRHRTIQTRQTT